MTALTIGSNLASLKAIGKLDRASAALSSTFERLSTGQRINRASDDSAGLSVAAKLETDTRIFSQGVRNLSDGLSLLGIADSTVESLSGIVIRLRELATQSASGTLSNAQREALDAEAQEFAKEYNRITRSTSFNGRALFDGELGDVSLQAGYGQLVVGVGGAISDGTFSASVLSGGVFGQPYAAVSGDFNGDGMEDFATADYGGFMRVRLGHGDGTFQSAQVNLVGAVGVLTLSKGDFDNDGHEDLVSTVIGGEAQVYIGLGDGSFTPSTSYVVGGQPWGSAVGDFNGDGVDDFVTADAATGTVSLFVSRGDGSFGPRQPIATGANPWGITAADVDGDGREDIAFTDWAAGRLHILLGQGDGSFAAGATYTTGARPASVNSGDFNSDGVIDLVTVDSSGGSLGVFLGQGGGTFAARVSYAAGSSPERLTTGDFDGDGIIDLALADGTAGTVSIFAGVGDGTFADRRSFTVGSNSSGVAAGDFNRDGVHDLAVVDFGNAADRVLIGNTTDGISALLPFSLADRASSRKAMASFENTLTILTRQRGEIGTYQARVQAAPSTLSAVALSTQEAEALVSNADIAHESAELARRSIVQQAAQSILAQANLQPALVLSLLEG